jgi:hypothetical protein
MPLERQYATNAERQAAYRARHRDRELPRQDLLAALARTLHGTLARAVAQGVSPLPPELLGPRADRTLQNLIRCVRAELKEEE